MGKNALHRLRAVIRDRRALESLEYAVFAVAFVVIIGGVIAAFGDDLTSTYTDIGSWVAGQAADM